MNITTPTDLQARMEKLVRDMIAGAPSDGNSVPHPSTYWGMIVRAQRLVAELPEPLDPDVLAVREILHQYQIATKMPYPNGDDLSFVKGSYDDTDTFKAALAAYKRIKTDRA